MTNITCSGLRINNCSYLREPIGPMTGAGMRREVSFEMENLRDRADAQARPTSKSTAYVLLYRFFQGLLVMLETF